MICATSLSRTVDALNQLAFEQRELPSAERSRG